jgi:dipeptidase
LAKPCTSFYIPFYFGIDDFPRAFYTQSHRPSLNFYRRKVESPFQPAPNQAFWTFSNFAHKADRDYETTITRVKAEARQLENRAFSLQKPIEEIALKLYPKDKAAAMDLLANYSKGLYLSALEATDRILSQK